MQKLSTSWTLGQLIAHCQSRLKDFDAGTIPHDLWMEILNSGAGELQRLLELTDADEYRDKVDLTIGAVNAGGIWNATNAGITYTDATKTLHIPDAAFAGGNWSAGITNFNNGAIFLGAVVMFHAAAGGVGPFLSYIVSITGNNDAVIADAFGSDIAANGWAAGACIIPGNNKIVNIGQLSFYKQIDRINGIFSNTYGECFKKTQSEFWGITKPSSYHPHYTKLIIWYRDGELLYFERGTLTSFGTLTMHYFHTPYPMALDSDLLDIRDSEVNMLLDLAVLKGFETLKVPIPQELKGAEGRLQALRQSVDEKKAKLLTDSKP